MYKANEVAGHFGVTLQTVYRWTDSLKQFMSAGAHPATKDKEYNYSDRDMSIFSMMYSMREEGSSMDTINNSIRASIDMDNLEVFEGLNPPTSITLKEADYTEIDSRVQEIVQERDNLRAELVEAQKTIAVLESQVGGIQPMRDEISTLNRLIGRLEAKIEMLQED